MKNPIDILTRAKWYVKVPAALIIILLEFVLLIILVDINFLWLFGTGPTMEQIGDITQSEASVIYTADGKVMGKFFSENRTRVKYEEISPKLIKTLVCTEDERFYSHHGIDFQGIGSAAKDFVLGRRARGASTITQQLVKNLYKARSGRFKRGILGRIPGVKLVVMKLKEWIAAVKIESRFSKEEIITLYLNTVDFGSNAFGINTAAKTYFNVKPKDLDYAQSAVLVGLLKATTTYNPRINPKNSLKRRNTVLANMLRLGKIPIDEYDSIVKQPIKLDYYVENNYDGMALYFRDALANELSEWCDTNEVNLYTDGLKIYTTIDSTMQAYAEQAVREQMQVVQQNFRQHWYGRNPWRDEQFREIPNFIENIVKRTVQYKKAVAKFGEADTAAINAEMQRPRKVTVFDYELGSIDTTLSVIDSVKYMVKFMHGSLIAIEPQTGYIKAWVGDLDFRFWKYDKVTAMRQPGSTFKLFDYAEAMNQGMSPCEERTDQYVSWKVWDKGKQKLWIPHNAEGTCTDLPFSLKAAFARSINTIAVQISKEVGIDKINATAHRMGIHSPLCDTIPATCLGGSDVTLLELTNAYSTVINDGVYHAPIFVTRIEDRHGNVIYTPENTDSQALDYEPAFLMQQLLKGGMTEYGTTSGFLWNYVRPFYGKCEFGGKTGTSSNHSDAWFMGVMPSLVGGVWVGGEYRCIHFRTGELGQGNATALPIYGIFLKKLLSDPNYAHYLEKFPKPKVKISRPYNCKAYIVKDSTAVDSTIISTENQAATTPAL
ncbi:MAG: transglycosylase domain-containing protein [Bacteroidales bacterium]|nr:transglycosylase domain-containing protein [Bacteroidales bacterium]